MTRNKSLLLRGAEVLVRAVYRISTQGLEKLPEGGFLLLPNHVTWVDAVVLQAACPRPIRFMVDREIYQQRALNWVFRLIEAIPISRRQAKEAVRLAAEQIEAGEIVCIFPEGELSRTGVLLRLKRGYELIARQADAPVVPVWLDQLWGSIFSFYRGRFFRKIPRHLPYPVTVAFGAPLPAEKADIARVRQELLALGEWCYGQRPILQKHLAEACLRGLKHRQFEVALIDGLDQSETSRGTLLAAACALSRELRKLKSKRLAVVLPPSRGAVIANLAVMLAGKVPVNLNFTAGRGALEAAQRIAQIEQVITAGRLMKKLTDFPWPAQVLKLEELVPPLKKKIVLWRVLIVLLPWRALARLLEIPSTGDREEAVILFTSGSSGEPKGVVLSHRNLLANVSQFALMLNLSPRDTLLASLPFFHSFGCTVTLWYPLIEGVRVVTYPNPVEAAKNAELIEKHRVTLTLSTPTFLRGYLRKVEPAQLASVELLVTGAEKLPDELAQAFEERFGVKVEQGYGLTETSPVVSVNLPEPLARPGDSVQPTSRRGSVGKLAPGLAPQIRDVESGAPLSLHETGMLWLRGPNIFEGYLDDPQRTAEVVVEGWFKTGDLGRFDEDGFLFIEGRLSRFSKIAGEMVPHETVETAIGAALALSSDERVIVVTGVPDEAKGEALVLLSSIDIDLAELRGKLADAGLPNLWVPRRVQRVDALPTLASGKLDLKACRDLAMK